MIVLYTLERIFNGLFLTSFFMLFVAKVKEVSLRYSDNCVKGIESDNSGNNASSNERWKDIVELLILISTVIVFVFVVILMSKNIKNSYWLIIIGVPGYLNGAINVYKSFEIVEKVVKSNEKGKMTFKDQIAIHILSYAFWVIGGFNIFEKVIEKAYNYKNVYLSDIMIALFYIFLTCTYLFFICSFFWRLFVSFMCVAKFVYSKLPCRNMIIAYGNYWICQTDSPIRHKSILVLQWEIIEKWNPLIRWIRYFLLPFSFALDIIIMIFKVLISLIASTIGYFCILVKKIKKTLYIVVSCIIEISDIRIVSMSFRISIIMALIFIVALNRYETIFRIQEASTAILEFLASTIIIPIIFEWISTIKKDNLRQI